MTELATVPVHRPPGGGEFTLAQLRADPLRFHLDPYRRSGPLYRLALDGREVTVIAGPEANEFAWRNTDLWNWPAMKNTFRRAFSERYLTAMEGEGHRRKRRRMVQGFKPGVIEAHTGAMSAALERLLSTHAGRSVDLRWFCNHLILDETAAMLGVDLPSSVAELAIEFEKLLLLDVYGTSDDVRRRLRAAQGAFMDEMVRIVDVKAAEPGPARDPFGVLMRAEVEGEPPLTREELAEDLALFFLAGTETTAHVVLWALMLMEARPDWWRELRAETAGWDPAKPDALDALPRVRATVLETERLFPPLVGGVLMSHRDFVFAGVTIPAGTPVMHPREVVHFLDEVYEEPLRFRPERHLGRTYPARVQATFGGGGHICLGLPLARIQSALSLATLARGWDVRVQFAPILDCRMENVLTPPLEHLPVVFEPRPA